MSHLPLAQKLSYHRYILNLITCYPSVSLRHRLSQNTIHCIVTILERRIIREKEKKGKKKKKRKKKNTHVYNCRKIESSLCLTCIAYLLLAYAENILMKCTITVCTNTSISLPVIHIPQI